MGTSKNYSAPPAWGPAKAAVTRAADNPLVTPAKAAALIGEFVSQMRHAARGGFAESAHRGAGGGDRGGGGGRGGRGGAGGSSGGSGGLRGTAQALGSFLSEVAIHGLKGALAALGITDLADKSPTEIALLLADLLGGPASTMDDVDLRAALCELIRELTDAAADLTEAEAALQNAATDLEQVIRNLFGHYIFERFNATMCGPLDQKKSVQNSTALLSEAKRYIDTCLLREGQVQDLTQVDWGGAQGGQIVERILQDTIAILEE